MKQNSILLFLITCVIPVFAQNEQCQAESKFAGIQCIQRDGGEKCVSISVMIDNEGMEFDYEWELGDGTVKKGKEIAHCYESYDVYEVKLNLIDPNSGFKFRRELVQTINIYDSGAPQIVTDREITPGSDIRFDYILENPDFIVGTAYWAFDDGRYTCTSNPIHKFDSIRDTEVRLLLSGIKNGQLLEVCVSETFSVKEFILDGKELNDVFAQKEQTLENRGRFLNDEVHYIIYEKDNPQNFQLLDIKEDKYNVKVEPGKIYEMYAWKGNLFTPIEGFSTEGLSETLAQEKLKETIQLLFSKVPLHIEGLKFDLDSQEPPASSINQVAELMNTYKHVKIGIGVYTHTGGRMDKNLDLSRERGEKIREAIVAQGVDTARLSVLTATEEHDLLNTCYGVLNCDLEDESLNRRAEFKVEGIEGGELL